MKDGRDRRMDDLLDLIFAEVETEVLHRLRESESANRLREEYFELKKRLCDGFSADECLRLCVLDTHVREQQSRVALLTGMNVGACLCRFFFEWDDALIDGDSTFLEGSDDVPKSGRPENAGSAG